MSWFDIGAGLLNFLGGRDQNRANAQEAQKNRDWQERMSNTAYTRAAADMERAGLNRILALGSPASTPGGAQARFENELGPAVTTALQAKRLSAELKQIKAQTEKIKSEKEFIDNKSQITEGAANVMDDAVNLYDAGKNVLRNEAGGFIDKAIQGVKDTAKGVKDKFKEVYKNSPLGYISENQKKRTLEKIERLKKIPFNDSITRYYKLPDGTWFDMKQKKVLKILTTKRK